MTEIIVDPAGGGDYTTIQGAADVAVGSDRVRIKAGTYTEQVKPANSGSSGNYITYEPFGNGDVIVDGEDSRAYCVWLNGKDYHKFQNFRITRATTTALLVSVGSDYVTVADMTVDNSIKGIHFAATTGATITNIIVRDCAISQIEKHGIWLEHKVYDVVIANNIIDYPGTNVDAALGMGIEVNDEFGGQFEDGPRDVEIYGNEISNGRDHGIRVAHCQRIFIHDNHCHLNGFAGIQIEIDANNIIVRDNISEYNSQLSNNDTGIWVDSTYNCIVEGNIARYNCRGIVVAGSEQVIVRKNSVYGNKEGSAHNLRSTGLSVDGRFLTEQIPTPEIAETVRISFIHNNLFNNGHADNINGSGIAVGQYDDADQMKEAIFKNNIVSSSAGSYDLNIHAEVTGHILDFNCYYNTRDFLADNQGSDENWADWKANSGQDASSILSDPLLTEMTNGHLGILRGSPCLGGGAPLTTAASAGSGTNITVNESMYFTDGEGITSGDEIIVGSNLVRVTEVDYGNNIITVDKSISWASGDNVSYPYSGSGPDIGAYEYLAEDAGADITTYDQTAPQKRVIVSFPQWQPERRPYEPVYRGKK